MTASYHVGPCTYAERMGVCLLVVSTLAAAEQSTDHSSERALLGGDTTIHNDSPAAFEQQAPNLQRMEKLLFSVGDSFFNQNWVSAPASTQARDGLGPLFNARSCAGCHFKDGRGHVSDSSMGEQSDGFLIRLALPEQDEHQAYKPDPNYGGQFQDKAIGGVPAEGTIVIGHEAIDGKYGDGTPYELQAPHYSLENLAYGDLHSDVTLSPRIANQVIGLGLLEAIPEATLLTLADPEDADGDGISGRPNRVWDAQRGELSMGRFGWKANQPSLLQQIAGAFNGDMGITTDVFGQINCTGVQPACIAAPHGGEPEIDADDLRKMELYVRALGVPAQRNPDDPLVRQGESLFEAADCQACHMQEVQTGDHPLQAVAHQRIRPFTDLLLHDMGEALADHQADFDATGSEWRTPPLWGIGLFETVSGHTTYLHDGRARNLAEAILWHGGEAERSRDAFRAMPESDREALLAFLGSL